jgi:protein-S-isoprenylcysteine O-methyltransferase Ste14
MFEICNLQLELICNTRSRSTFQESDGEIKNIRRTRSGAKKGDTILSMKASAYAVLAVGWVVWLTPFFLFKRSAGSAKEIDRRARWGVLLVAIAYSMLWQSKFWERPLEGWRIALSILFFLLAALLSWTAKRALGRQWRIDAGLNPDHELVMAGPYRVVRHPIYTSMLCILLATGIIVTPWWLLSLSLFVFAAGTEIRVRIEDQLLSSRFGQQFRDYRHSVPSYVPFLR